MWRLWTKGWGFRSWWYWMRVEAIPMWIAFKIPPRIALWVFIRVHALSGDGHTTYESAYDDWVAKYKLSICKRRIEL